MKEEITICWLRRDLRLNDNAALYHALKSSGKVLILFLFDKEILQRLEDKSDKRVAFIHERLTILEKEVQAYDSSLRVVFDFPVAAFEKLQEEFDVKAIYSNRDYELSAMQRDFTIEEFATKNNIDFQTFKDQVIFEKDEVMKKLLKLFCKLLTM